MPKLGRGETIYDAQRVLTLALDELGGGAGGVGSLLLNRILHFDASSDTITLYEATQAGLLAALVAATAGDTVRLPSRTITLTTAITVPSGASLAGIVGGAALLSFSGFGGVAITLAAYARATSFALDFSATTSPSTGINGRALGTWIEQVRVRVTGPGPGDIGIDTGAGEPVREVWLIDCVSLTFGTPKRLLWSNNFFDPTTTVWNVSALPAGLTSGPGSQPHGFDVSLDGQTGYLLSYDTTIKIWRTLNLRDASPTWTAILTEGGGGGGPADMDGVGQIWAHGANLYCMSRTSGIGGPRYHGKYDGAAWTWTITPITHVWDSRNEAVFPAHYTWHAAAPIDNAVYNLAGVPVHSWLYSASFTPNNRNSWLNAMGGPKYLPVALPGDPANTSRLRNVETGVDLLTGLIGNPRNVWVRGAWLGVGACITVPYAVGTAGDLWTSGDGIIFSLKSTWQSGVVEPGNLDNLDRLAWARLSVSTGSGAEIIRASLDGGITWVNKTGNFWSIHTENGNWRSGHMKIAIY
jgi:hypothetical protein